VAKFILDSEAKTRRDHRAFLFAAWRELHINDENPCRKTRVRQDVSIENLECNHASQNERTMMLKIGLMRQAINVNEKAGLYFIDRPLAIFLPDIARFLWADSFG
jgi:hypothetical protein